MTHNKFYYECPWCGNRWYQEELEPRKCEVCNHFIWEGTEEEHLKFPDLEAWRMFTEAQKEYKEDREWDYMAHTDIRS